MMEHIKRLLGITHRVRPITMDDVAPAKQDPDVERRVKAATSGLANDIMHLERSSYEIRQALASRTLRLIVNNGQQGHQKNGEE